MTREEAVLHYGQVYLKPPQWDNEAEWMTLLPLPKEINSWINRMTGQPIYHLYLNKDFSPLLLNALHGIIDLGLTSELKFFDGSYNIREVRGFPGMLSEHSYGCAIDINARENPLGGESKFSPAFVKCFLDAGLQWGGTFPRKDAQHFCMYGW